LDMESCRPNRWMKRVLWAAAGYNLIWGSLVVLFPQLPFQWAGINPPVSIELWQCIGIMAGVFGVGYAIAAINPYQQWPIVLVGLLAKICGPIGLLRAAQAGALPWAAGWTIVPNDLIWWIPFALILRGAYQAHVAGLRKLCPDVLKFALRTKVQGGCSLDRLSRETPLMVVFLRHGGCIFCREALQDIAAQRRAIEATGTRLVLVHMGTAAEADALFRRYGLQDVMRIADSEQTLYRAFGLRKGRLRELFGPKVLARGFEAGILHRHGIGRRMGDGFQMPGVFLIYHGEVIRSYRHQSAADRPEYLRFATQS
jgi:peroxiredoxin